MPKNCPLARTFALIIHLAKWTLLMRSCAPMVRALLKKFSKCLLIKKIHNVVIPRKDLLRLEDGTRVKRERNRTKRLWVQLLGWALTEEETDAKKNNNNKNKQSNVSENDGCLAPGEGTTEKISDRNRTHNASGMPLPLSYNNSFTYIIHL